MHLRFALLLIAALCAPIPALAAPWFTKEACTVTDPAIDPDAIDAAMMQQIQAQAAKIEIGIGRLWKITAPNGAVSHLWGTMHSSNPLILDLPDAVIEVIAPAQTVAVERNAVFQSRADVDQFWLGPPIWSHHAGGEDWVTQGYLAMDPRILNWVGQRLSSIGFHDGFSAFKPALIVQMLFSDPCNDFTYTSIPIQDDRIQMLGMIAGANIVGLETDKEFFADLEANPDVAFALVEIFGRNLDPTAIRPNRRSAFALYLTGRIAALEVWDQLRAAAFFGAEKALRLHQVGMGYLLDARNDRFVAATLPLLQQGGTFIAVGTSHLHGPTGLVRQFRDNGFTVERIPLPGEVPG